MSCFVSDYCLLGVFFTKLLLVPTGFDNTRRILSVWISPVKVHVKDINNDDKDLFS